jgi:succinoglycan biosynthesis transport protein ExoP
MPEGPGSSDERPQGRLRIQAGALIGVCLILGVLVAVVFGAFGASRYTVKALIRVTPDPSLTDAGTLSSDQLTDFVQGELLTLNGANIRTEAERSSHAEDVDLNATQQGNTSVIELQATGPHPDSTALAATTLIKLYQQRRVSEVTSSTQSSQQTVNDQIASVRKSLAALGSDPNGSQSNALTNELSRLITLGNQLQLQVTQAAQTVVVLQAASAADASKTSSIATNAELGGLLGLVVGLGLAVVRVRLAPNRLLASEVRAEVPGVPIVELPRIPGPATLTVASEASRRRVSVPIQSLQRRLAGRTSSFGRPPLLIVGDRPGVGSSYLAIHLAIASAQMAPTVIVNAGDTLDNTISRALGNTRTEGILEALDAADPVDAVRRLLRPTAVPRLYLLPIGFPGTLGLEAIEGATAAGLPKVLALLDMAVIVDAPPLSHSSFALDVARDAGAVALVMNANGSRRRAIGEAAEALFAVRPDIDLLVLNRPRGRSPIHRK